MRQHTKVIIEIKYITCKNNNNNLGLKFQIITIPYYPAEK